MAGNDQEIGEKLIKGGLSDSVDPNGPLGQSGATGACGPSESQGPIGPSLVSGAVVYSRGSTGESGPIGYLAPQGPAEASGFSGTADNKKHVCGSCLDDLMPETHTIKIPLTTVGVELYPISSISSSSQSTYSYMHLASLQYEHNAQCLKQMKEQVDLEKQWSESKSHENNLLKSKLDESEREIRKLKKMNALLSSELQKSVKGHEEIVQQIKRNISIDLGKLEKENDFLRTGIRDKQVLVDTVIAERDSLLVLLKLNGLMNEVTPSPSTMTLRGSDESVGLLCTRMEAVSKEVSQKRAPFTQELSTEPTAADSDIGNMTENVRPSKN